VNEVLSFDDVRYAYTRGTDVLHGVSFALAPGEVVGLLGKNGAGKTTLLRIAMGLLDARSGSARLFGLDPRREPLAVKRRVGYVSEEQILPPLLTVREAIALHRRLYPTWDDGLAERLGERFRLSPRARIGSLSVGEARRVALLCAVSHRPELLLLDEPAGGLDPVARREFLETAIQLLNEAGTAILFSSHYLFDVERLAGRAVVLDEGQVLLDSALDDLRERHALALVPHGGGATADALRALRALPGCLAARERPGALHAVFALDPDGARALVARELGVDGVTARAVALEELFIELLGGRL
jgi:ABC-2 type transport system ATP-binding protein